MPARSPSETSELTRLGSYTIVRKLAKGGMAELFLARSSGPEGFEKLVVLKKILPRYAENPRFVQLFLDEAKLAASLDHPHIVQVYDMGRIDGNYFFTMEYVHGQDTRMILRQTTRQKMTLPIGIAVQIARTVASALHHAHERKNADGTLRNIVHRDVSPSNVLVSYDGAIKLADFGVAKAASSTVRTRTGALKGKVGYMSPEQARGLSIDRRSDVFSLGVVLWEMVSMRRLFKTDNDLATIQAIINTPPAPLSDHRPDCPPELDRIVNKALQKEPGPRYQTAQEMQRDLDELARELKLDQSSIHISQFMAEVFAPELAALRAAQDMGSTIVDYLVSASGEHNTPVSESELSLEDPGDDEHADLDEDEEDDLEEHTELPARAGLIDRDADEATDFGPPPSMDSAMTPIPIPKRANTPAPGVSRISSGPITSAKPPAAVPVKSSDKPTEKLPVAPAENPFDSLATRLRPNPMRHADDQSFEDNGSTTVASPAFTEEAPTVTAPPDIVKQAFADVQETVQGKKFPDEQSTSPFDPLTEPFEQASGFEPTAVQFEPPPELREGRAETSTPLPTEPPRQTALGYSTQPPPTVPAPLRRVATPLAVPQMMKGVVPAADSADEPETKTLPGRGTPPIGMPPYPVPPAMPPGMPGAMPGMHPDPSGGMLMRPPTQPRLDPSSVNRAAAPFGAPSDLDLTPQKRWLVIGGVAVGVAVVAILLILLLGGGSSEPVEEVAPDAAPVEPSINRESKQGGVEPAAKPAPKPAAKPASKPKAVDPGSGSGSTVAPAALPTNNPINVPPKKIIQPPKRPPPKRR